VSGDSIDIYDDIIEGYPNYEEEKADKQHSSAFFDSCFQGIQKGFPRCNKTIKTY
jgi:hypothetical protein